MSPIYGLTGTRLPIHPQPHPDELLTHWFFRLAHANHLKAQTLADYTFGRYSSFWARDQDKLASPLVISRLSDLTGQLPDDIYGMTLAAYEGKLYATHHAGGHSRWILPLGIYHRTWRGFGLQYCPLCLRADDEPYFRRRWRLALSTVCEKHGTLMHDRCYRCGAPAMFFRSDLGNRARHVFGSSASCHACGADLSQAPAYDPPGPPGQTLAILRSLDLGFTLGWWWAGSDTINYGHHFFDVLHWLATLLVSGKGRKLLQAVERRIGITPLGSQWSRQKIFELRPIEERHWLVLMALWLLQDWPDRFVETCRAARMWQSWLLSGEPLPWWFFRVAKEYLDRSIYCPNAEEAKNAAAFLSRRGEVVTKRAVGQLLGGSFHQASQDYVVRPAFRWPQAEKEFDELLAAADLRIQSLEPGSVRHLLVLRDKTVIALMKNTGWKAAVALKLRYADLSPLLARCEVENWGDALGLLRHYAQSIRPALIQAEHMGSLFVGYNWDGFSVEALAHRLKGLQNPGRLLNPLPQPCLCNCPHRE